jgi:3-oxoacyl-[acyl-carrier-protein] synthase-3
MVEASETVLRRNGITGADLACFIPHQANRRIITSSAERLGLRDEQVIINIDRFGNTTAATIPLATETAIRDGRLKKDDYILMASVGAGFTVGAALLRWEF